MFIDFKMQSTLHVGIIMDGNGRWALARGLPRAAGHCAGADAVRRAIEAAPDAGIGALTLFAFSSDNWKRPPEEVDALMRLLQTYLEGETEHCSSEGVRLEVIGRRDRLDPRLRQAIEAAESATAAGSRLHLRLAVDYSGRDAILAAARSAPASDRQAVDALLGPAVDLLIRTGGEHRLSDFLLWECAYAELIFSRKMWPDFDGCDLRAAVREFHTRQRRFGAVPPPPEAQPAREFWLD